MERRIKEINRFTVGWTAYFALADTSLPFERLDQWLRRRLRPVRWKRLGGLPDLRDLHLELALRGLHPPGAIAVPEARVEVAKATLVVRPALAGRSPLTSTAADCGSPGNNRTIM